MAALKGIPLPSKIVPIDSADTYPTHDAIYGLGGYREVADNTARDAIPAARLNDGALVYVQSSETVYKWNGATFEPMFVPQYPIFWFFAGVPANSQYVACLAMLTGCTLKAGLTGSQFKIRVNPTATTVFTLFKGVTNIGTITFSTGGVATVSFLSDVAFAAGDVLLIQNQATADATAADISFSFAAALS